MTADEARQIDQLEFEREREAIRQRALEIVQAHKAKANARAEALAKLSPAGTQPQRTTQRRNPFNRASPGAKATTYTHAGLALTLAEWAERLGVSRARLHYRLRHGWPFDRVFTTENRRGLGRPSNDSSIGSRTYTHAGLTMTLAEWSKRLGVPYATLRDRRRRGLPLDLMLSPRSLTGKTRRRGVVANSGAITGTGGGSTAQETPEIDFSKQH